MSEEDPGSSEIGEILQEEYVCEVITWKIPHVSSLEITESTEILSPSFSYKKATWVLKMFPCGEKNCVGKFYLKVHLQRLDSEIPVHDYFCKYYFKQHKPDVKFKVGYYPVKFDSNMKENEIRGHVYCNFWYILYHRKSYRWNDTIILVVKILSKKTDTVGLDSKANLTDRTLGPKFDKNADSIKPIGELFIESFIVNTIAWKIPSANYIPVDNNVQSPAFSFAGVSWILKLFLCSKFKSQDVDVVIERLSCVVQKHILSYEMFFKSYNGNEFLNINYFKENNSIFFVKNSFIFDSDHVQENILNINSYREFLIYATSSRPLGTVVLVCKFQIPKETEIQLSFQIESLQPFNYSPPLKTENTGKAEIGEIIKKSFQCEVISWTIPSFSSLLAAEKNAVQSPQFSYKGANWILEFYPQNQVDGCSKMLMKRLNSQFPVHNFFYRSFFKKYDGGPIIYKMKSFISFHSNAEQRQLVWSCTNQNCCLYKEYRCNDRLTFVCELYTENNSVIEMDFKAQSFKATSGNINTESALSPKSVGELFIETFDVETITWKIPKARSFPIKVDYSVQSPSFPFAGASWILTMFPYGQKKFESELNVDLVIERTFSLFPKHSVLYRMYFEDANKMFDEKGNSLQNFCIMLDCSTTGSFIFESNYAKENVCCVESYSNFLSLAAPTRSSDTVFLVCDFRVKKNDGIKMNIQNKLAKSNTDSSEKNLEQSPIIEDPFSLFKDSLEKKTEQNFSVKNSSEKKLEQSPIFTSPSLFKESLEKKTEQNFSVQSCDNLPRESVDLTNKKILQDFKELFLKKEDCDVVLNVKGREFTAHRLILKARSSVFASTFRNDMKEKATGIVDIADCDPSSFSDFLYFLYCGSIEKLSSENVFSLFTAADKYDVQDLRSECLKFMKNNLSVDTFCDTIALALQHSERELIELATDFFSKNLQKVISTVKWQSFLVKNPIQGNELLIKALASNK